jgi:hypothetical protein
MAFVDELEDLPALEKAPGLGLILLRQSETAGQVSARGLLEASSELRVERGELTWICEPFEG